MLSYAVSCFSFGDLTPEAVEAFKASRIKKVELLFSSFLSKENKIGNLARKMVSDKVVIPASIHLPFCGENWTWDVSMLDEDMRRESVDHYLELLRQYEDLIPGHVTLHASNDLDVEPEARRSMRIRQVCRSIEEMLPYAEKIGFSINVEYLPRECIGHSEEELLKIVSSFDSPHVGICFDVNHVMKRWRQVPEMIDLLAPYVRTFHISDYDGIDETHWFPGQGVLNWPEIMKRIKAIDHDVLLILETVNQLGRSPHRIHPIFALRQLERSICFLENCDRYIYDVENLIIS